MSDTELENFSINFHQDVIAGTRDSANELFAEERFTELMLDYLADAGEIDDWELCSYQARGIKVNAYVFYNDNESLDLFVSQYTGDTPPVLVGKNVLLQQLKRLHSFFEKAITGQYASIEESSPAFDLADRIFHSKDTLKQIRFFVLTDGKTGIDTIENNEKGSYRITDHIWDLQRLHRLVSSDRKPEPIEIDFLNEFGYCLPCLPMPEDNSVYSTYLCILSAATLSDLYGRYGSRLLERNVRAYLQMRGNVNKGIRTTIIEQPHMFLAYNNGISATADVVEIINNNGQMPAVRKIRDFQIVNGAQTTASIYHTRTKDKQDVASVYVQLKLTVIKSSDDVDTIVPRISEYSNSQNKINAADFTSNDPFHISIQKLSRRIWAPAKGGRQLETHWYYERVRGQYQDDKSRKATAKEKRIFSDQNPTNQRFRKTDLAKYEQSWDQRPHIVSLGAEKNYRDFIIRSKDGLEELPDENYFRLIIAKAILFKETDRLVLSQRFGGYKANIVTYTVAFLSMLTDKKIDLERIWREQDLSPSLKKTIIDISRLVHNHITTPPDGRNITEWCKKEECWLSLLKKKYTLPDDVLGELKEQQPLPVQKPVIKNESIDIFSPITPPVAVSEETKKGNFKNEINFWAKKFSCKSEPDPPYEITNYTCPICHQLFANESARDQHVGKMHGFHAFYKAFGKEPTKSHINPNEYHLIGTMNGSVE